MGSDRAIRHMPNCLPWLVLAAAAELEFNLPARRTSSVLASVVQINRLGGGLAAIFRKL